MSSTPAVAVMEVSAADERDEDMDCDRAVEEEEGDKIASAAA